LERAKGIEPSAEHGQAVQSQPVAEHSDTAYAQIRAQIQGKHGRDLTQVVEAWDKLPAPLKARNPRHCHQRRESGGQVKEESQGGEVKRAEPESEQSSSPVLRSNVQPTGVAGLYEQTIKEFVPASWFHPVGIFKVLARIWDRLPDVGGKLFLTFTLDPKLYANEEAAFEDSRKWLRKVFFQLRHGVEHEGRIYTIDAPYCVKVEFHESGWVHYHVIFLTRRFLPKELLAELWGLGWVKVQRITNKDFHYLLKYVTKPDDLPEWVKNRKRLRVFQTTKGFPQALNQTKTFV
jgi:hypothetical protein